MKMDSTSMSEIDKPNALLDRDTFSTQDLTQRLISAELLAETAEKNAIAAERARSRMHVELRAVQMERDKLGAELAALTTRLEHIKLYNENPIAEKDYAAAEEIDKSDVFFSTKLSHPLGKIADFDLFYQDGRSFVVHPLAFETVVVEITCLPSEEVSELKLQVIMPDERARPVEYALCIVGESNCMDVISHPGFRWNVLNPEETAEVSVHWPVKVRPAAAMICVRPVDPKLGHDYCGTKWSILSVI